MSAHNNGKFSLVRHEILDDDKFAEVYENNDLLATWLRLLIGHDKTYPAPAAIPYGTKKAAVAKLSEIGLIDVLPHGQYVMHGMAAEREARSKRFKDAVEARIVKHGQQRRITVDPSSTHR